jgi:hypothetical protein
VLIVFIAGLLTGAVLVAAGVIVADRLGRFATEAPDDAGNATTTETGA